ncbi:putative AC transposase [Fusarium oxysporum f. sp. conglutinans]|nr:putative AC transposase [Fusarium oxysporum f. sp. conglutinans]
MPAPSFSSTPSSSRSADQFTELIIQPSIESSAKKSTTPSTGPLSSPSSVRAPRPLADGAFPIRWGALQYNNKRLSDAHYYMKHKRTTGKTKKSWIWDHGANIESENEQYWLCRRCHETGSDCSTIFKYNGNSAIAYHLKHKHGISEDGEVPQHIRVSNPWDRSKKANSFGPLRTPIAGEGYRQQYLDWVVAHDVSFRSATAGDTCDLLSYGRPELERLLPTSATTLSSWIMAAFETRRESLKAELKECRSAVHLSCDLWTSTSGMSLCGVVAHFVGVDYTNHQALLGLPRLYGSHSGENIANCLSSVLTQYDLEPKLGCFMMDNAQDNDRAVLQLATRFGFDPDWRRLRCSGHVINLVVKAILYGKGVSKAERQLQCCNDQESFSIWRQRGVIGKVHNIVRYITRSDQRRQHFETLQAEALQDDELFSLQLIKDGGIRWNSTFSMLERALKLRNAIELFCAQWERDADYDLSQDFLKRSDWEEIQRFVALLKPFKDATLELEGHAIHGNYGALWQALEMMDILDGLLQEEKAAVAADPRSYSNYYVAGLDQLSPLLTSPSGTISFVISAASSYLDITASRAFDIPGSAPLRFPAQPTSAASAAQTTLAAFYRSTLEGHRILTHILTCSPTLPRPTFVASAAKQDQQPSAARLSGPSVAPNFDARASNGSLPFS